MFFVLKLRSYRSEKGLMRLAKTIQAEKLDPLYVIFEQHLYNFNDSDADRKTFITKIVEDYLTYLRKMNILIPKSLESSIVEELAGTVNTMLIKKIYGCLSLDDYRKDAPLVLKKKAKNRYQRLSRARRRVV